MFSNALPALALFLLILFYFPSAPELPPSLSSQQARLGTWAGLREVMASLPSWLVAVGCSVPQAVLSRIVTFDRILDQNTGDKN